MPERRHRRDHDALGRGQVGEAGGEVAAEDLVDLVVPGGPASDRQSSRGAVGSLFAMAIEPGGAAPRPPVARGGLRTRSAERDALFETISGHPIEPLYTEEDLADFDPERDARATPASSRTPAASIRRCTAAGCGRCASSPASARSRRPTSASATCSTTARHGLSTAFDMPTLMGLDSDHARSLGEVGVEGVALDTVDDMETLFDGIPLDEVTVSMTINAPAAILLAFYVVAAEEKGIPAERLGGTIQTDILKEYIAQKEWCFPIEPAMRLVTDMVEWCSTEMPRWHPISISGYHIREAGSTAQQELAFTLKDGFTYVERALERGLDVDDFAPRLSFFFNAHIDFFEEIAKYRAARRIWAREMRDTYGATRRALAADALPHPDRRRLADRPAAARQHRPDRRSRRSPACSAAPSRCTPTPIDEALALPTEEAVRVALRTQQVIAHETGRHEHRSTRSAAPTSSRSSPTRWRRPPTTTSPASTSSAGWSRRSSGLPAARDRRRRLPLPARGRLGQADRGRRQRLPARRRARCPSSTAPTRRPSGSQAGRLAATRRRAATTPPSSAALAELTPRPPTRTRT